MTFYICGGCPGWAWEANGPGDVYGPESHPLKLGSLGSHEWTPMTVTDGISDGVRYMNHGGGMVPDPDGKWYHVEDRPRPAATDPQDRVAARAKADPNYRVMLMEDASIAARQEIGSREGSRNP